MRDLIMFPKNTSDNENFFSRQMHAQRSPSGLYFMDFTEMCPLLGRRGYSSQTIQNYLEPLPGAEPEIIPEIARAIKLPDWVVATMRNKNWDFQDLMNTVSVFHAGSVLLKCANCQPCPGVTWNASTGEFFFVPRRLDV